MLVIAIQNFSVDKDILPFQRHHNNSIVDSIIPLIILVCLAYASHYLGRTSGYLDCSSVARVSKTISWLQRREAVEQSVEPNRNVGAKQKQERAYGIDTGDSSSVSLWFSCTIALKQINERVWKGLRPAVRVGYRRIEWRCVSREALCPPSPSIALILYFRTAEDYFMRTFMM
jgi:hypothetical protein